MHARTTLKAELLNNIRELFPPEKYGWGDLLKGSLCFDEVYGLKIKKPANMQGRYDCALGSAYVQQMLEANNFHSQLCCGNDYKRLFGCHFWVMLEADESVIDVTPVYPLVGATHVSDCSINPERILKQTHMYIPSPVPLSFTQEGTTQFLSFLGSSTALSSFNGSAMRRGECEPLEVGLLYELCCCEKGVPQQKYWLTIQVDREQAEKTVFLPKRQKGIDVLEALVGQELIRVNEFILRMQDVPVLDESYVLRAQQDWDVIGAFTLNVVQLLRRTCKKKATLSSQFNS